MSDESPKPDLIRRAEQPTTQEHDEAAGKESHSESLHPNLKR